MNVLATIIIIAVSVPAIYSAWFYWMILTNRNPFKEKDIILDAVPIQILWESIDRKRIVTWFHGVHPKNIYLVICEKLIPENEWGYDNLNNIKLVSINDIIEMETSS